MKDAMAEAHRYPQGDALRARLAELHRVKPEQVVLGCGSGEILRICTEAFTGSEMGLAIASPTYEAPGRHAARLGRRVQAVPLNSKYEHDLERMADTSRGQNGLIFVCNPNNPTASLTPRKAIEGMIRGLKGKEKVLVDEAYHHFALNSPDYVSFLDQPIQDDRVIVARTFSKIYGAAGIRIGYAVASVDAARRMREYAIPYGASVIALATALAGLNDTAGLAAAMKRNAADLAEFLRQAEQRNVKTIPAYGNFAMIDTGRPIRDVISYFRQKNIAIGRPFPPYETHARISFGKPAEMSAFWSAWDRMNA
jgi:histidinol-phosphate aminotransferase